MIFEWLVSSVYFHVPCRTPSFRKFFHRQAYLAEKLFLMLRQVIYLHVIGQTFTTRGFHTVVPGYFDDIVFAIPLVTHILWQPLSSWKLSVWCDSLRFVFSSEFEINLNLIFALPTVGKTL